MVCLFAWLWTLLLVMPSRPFAVLMKLAPKKASLTAAAAVEKSKLMVVLVVVPPRVVLLVACSFLLMKWALAAPCRLQVAVVGCHRALGVVLEAALMCLLRQAETGGTPSAAC